jgi:hypothetical protein
LRGGKHCYDYHNHYDYHHYSNDVKRATTSEAVPGR